MKNYNINHKKFSLVFSLAVGLVITFLITVIGAIIGSSLIHSGSIGEGAYGTVTFISWMLASFAGAYVSGACKKDKFLTVSLLTVAIYLFLMFSGSILFFGGTSQRIGQGILAIVIGYIPTYMINRQKSGQRKSKVRYRRR